MNTVMQFDKTHCNGCKMCKDICPVGAIRFEKDEEGFWYPQVDESRCIDCGLCAKTCPHNNGCIRYKEIPKVYAAWSNDTESRLECTSGGISYELGRKIISEGGYVVGCRYCDNYRGAEHAIAHTLEELRPLMQSKYLQSDTEGIYAKVKKLLDDGEKVMFVGTPCHNAALTNFLKKEYDNLVQVEFICRGISSPKAHSRYIDYLEEKYQSGLTYYRSKDKRETWNNFGAAARFENGQEYFMNRGLDPKTLSYHYDLSVRTACATCVCKNEKRVADITLADFWGIEASPKNPNLEQGTSAVLINSKKGEELFYSLKDAIGYYEKDIESVYRNNPALYHNISMSKYRTKFWSKIDKKRYDKLVEKYIKKIRGSWLRQKLRGLKRRILKVVR